MIFHAKGLWRRRWLFLHKQLKFCASLSLFPLNYSIIEKSFQTCYLFNVPNSPLCDIHCNSFDVLSLWTQCVITRNACVLLCHLLNIDGNVVFGRSTTSSANCCIERPMSLSLAVWRNFSATTVISSRWHHRAVHTTRGPNGCIDIVLFGKWRAGIQNSAKGGIEFFRGPKGTLNTQVLGLDQLLLGTVETHQLKTQIKKKSWTSKSHHRGWYSLLQIREKIPN